MLASCASTPSEPVSYDPATQARIRVFHAGRSYITLGHVCEPGKKESIHAAAGGYSFMVPNKVIGIPRTDDRLPRSSPSVPSRPSTLLAA